MSAPSPVARVKGLTKTYDPGTPGWKRALAALALRSPGHGARARNALLDVSFTASRGEIIGVLGLNGSGKTTLIRILAGVAAATSGVAEVNGRAAALLDLGAGFDPDLTGEENVRHVARLRGYSTGKARRALSEVLDFAEIGGHAALPVKTYSSGTFARLAFAMAMHGRPDLLLIDETLAVGDITFQHKCYDLLRQRRKDTATLFVTHDIQAFRTLATRGLLLDAGRLVLDANPSEVAERHCMRLNTPASGFHDDKTLRHIKKPTGQEGMGAAVAPGTANAAGAADAPGKAEAPACARPARPHPGPALLKDVPADILSGKGDVVIVQIGASVAGVPDSAAARPGDEVRLSVLVRSKVPDRRYFFGYMATDRFGNHVFGETSHALPGGNVRLAAAGEYLVEIAFAWPAMLPGEYALTVGIGEGHPHGQVIQCWAHNAVTLTAVNADTVLCLFNHPMSGFRVWRPGREGCRALEG